MKNQISVIIPTLNAAAHLQACLDAIAGAAEVIVVDGGSTDDTLAIARRANARTLTAPPGRGGQMRVGAAAAQSPYLLFLHADTILGPGWAQSPPAGQGGYYRLRFATPRRAARRLEALVRLRCRLFALPYGDQALLIAADLLAQIGGIPDLPLMEDVALARRLGRARLCQLPATVTTAATRYTHGGYIIRPLRNALCLALYFAGLPVRYIKMLYG
ncbi:MAG: glycosyltransferase [Acidocella sp.]|nr:glycosyltransferase [Acidocella sp.]